MSHEESLLATLAISLALAFAFGLLATRLRMPPLVGYLLAGIVRCRHALHAARPDGRQSCRRAGCTRADPAVDCARGVARTNSRELFTLAAIALALGVAYGAAKLFGVSVALGAFFAGMVSSGSDQSQRAASYLQPLQDTFAALFFVAVGTLFEPLVLVQHPLQVLAVLAIIIFAKSLAAALIVLLLGRPLRTAGESYIVAGALLSIMLNPLWFALLGRTRTAASVDVGL